MSENFEKEDVGKDIEQDPNETSELIQALGDSSFYFLSFLILSKISKLYPLIFITSSFQLLIHNLLIFII